MESTIPITPSVQPAETPPAAPAAVEQPQTPSGFISTPAQSAVSKPEISSLSISTEQNIDAGVQKTVEALMVKPIIAEAFSILDARLPSQVRYHTRAHSDDVLHESVLFALTDGTLSERETELLAITAAWHDVGFVERPTANEEIGASMAEDAMRKDGGYTDEEIEAVAEMIMSTQIQVKFKDQVLQLVQQPMSEMKISSERLGMKDKVPGALAQKLAGFLQDADVSNFGRNDALDKSELVYEETCQFNPDKHPTEQQFLNTTLNSLMEPHQWKTKAARDLRQAGKESNMVLLEDKIAAYVVKDFVT